MGEVPEKSRKKRRILCGRRQQKAAKGAGCMSLTFEDAVQGLLQVKPELGEQ